MSIQSIVEDMLGGAAFKVTKLKDNTFDVVAERGLAIRSPVSGTVRVQGIHEIDGQYIHIGLGGGQLRVLHMESVTKRGGNRIHRGDVIGYTGDSGMLKHTGFRFQVIHDDTRQIVGTTGVTAMLAGKLAAVSNSNSRNDTLLRRTSEERKTADVVDKLNIDGQSIGLNAYGRRLLQLLLQSGLNRRMSSYIVGVAAGESNLQNIAEIPWSIDQLKRYKHGTFRNAHEAKIAEGRVTIRRNLQLVSDEFLDSIKGNAREIFALMYDGNKNLGHEDYPYRSYVGYKYRGRGPIQITGMDAYRAAANYIGDQRIFTDPDIILTDDDLAARLVVWFYTIYKKNTTVGRKILAGDATFTEILNLTTGNTSIESVNRRLAVANQVLEALDGYV